MCVDHSYNISEEQEDLIKHTLGLNDKKESYRNHFVTSPSSDEFDDLEYLVELGLMTRRDYFFIEGVYVYHATEKAKKRFSYGKENK